MKNIATKNLFYGKYAYCTAIKGIDLRYYFARKALKLGDASLLDPYRAAGLPDNTQLIDLVYFLKGLNLQGLHYKVVTSGWHDNRLYYTDPRIMHMTQRYISERPNSSVRISKQYAPQSDKHAEAMENIQRSGTGIIKRRFVSTVNARPFKIMLSQPSEFMRDNNILTMLEEYERMGVLKFSLKYRKLRKLQSLGLAEPWHTRYAQLHLRVVDESAAVLLALALGKKYVHAIIEEVAITV